MCKEREYQKGGKSRRGNEGKGRQGKVREGRKGRIIEEVRSRNRKAGK